MNQPICRKLQSIMLLSVIALAACSSNTPATPSAQESPKKIQTTPVSLRKSQPDSPRVDDFNAKILPIVAKCQPCHFKGGTMYAKLPFDDPQTIRRLGAQLFSRIRDAKEQAIIRTFLAQSVDLADTKDGRPIPQDELAASIKAEGLASTIQKLEKLLERETENDQALTMLKRIVTEPFGISRDESLHLRKVIRRYSRHTTTVLASPDESGEPLIVSGTVRDAESKPISGALIYVFHADAKGYYTPDRPMDESNSRLFGYMKTGADGRYEFRTIRPGGYPHAPIPQHIHMLVTAAGYRDHACRSTCQLVFADDPRLTPEWHKWAKESGNPILSVTRDSDGKQRSVYDIVLKEK